MLLKMGCGASSDRDLILVDDLPSTRSSWSFQSYTPRHSRVQDRRGHRGGQQLIRYNRNFPQGEVNHNGLLIRLRRHLKACCDDNNLERLEEALKAYKEYSPAPDDDYYSAVRKLEYLKLRKGLRDALRRRHAGTLDDAIRDARKSPHAGRLGKQIEVAQKLRDHLRDLKLIKHDVKMDIDQKIISEIRGYSKPPSSVVKVMAAAFMLLGYTDRLTRSWSDIQTVLSRTGRDHTLSLMSEFNPTLVPPDIADKADAIIARYSLEEIRLASHGVSSFHVWTNQKLEDVYVLNGWKRRKS